MKLKDKLAFHSQLLLPAIPVMFDTVIRGFYLTGIVNVLKIPDLMALLATNAFFALNVHSSIRPNALPSDADYVNNAELARHQLMGIIMISLLLAGMESLTRAMSDAKGPDLIDWREGILSIVIIMFVLHSVREIIKRHLTWASG